MTKESKIMNIPVDRLSKVEKLLGRTLAENQVATVRVRVPVEKIEQVRKIIAK